MSSTNTTGTVITIITTDHRTFELDIQALSHLRTYRDVRQHLLREESGVHGLVLMHNTTELNDSDLINPFFTPLLFQKPQRTLIIHHLSQSQPIVVDTTARINEVIDRYNSTARPSILLTSLTFEGNSLTLTASLEELFIKNGADLYGLIRITMIDRDINRETTVDSTHDATIRQLKQEYATKEKRLIPDSAIVSLNVESKSSLDNESTLFHFDIGVDYNDKLYVQTLPFSVTIKEETSATTSYSSSYTITLYDSYSLRQVKEEYNKINPSNPLANADTLIFAGDEIDNDAIVYKLRMSEGSELLIRREELGAVRFEYICSDCGTDVHLKRNDAIRCRECGYRIVFKKRTPKLCQYLAR